MEIDSGWLGLSCLSQRKGTVNEHSRRHFLHRILGRGYIPRDNAMNSSLLPPKMAKQFAERARRGEATEVLRNARSTDETAIYIFRDGREEVVLFGLREPLSGHMTKIKP